MRLCSTKCQLRDECSGNNVAAAGEKSKLSLPVTDMRSIDACYGESLLDIPMPSKENGSTYGDGTKCRLTYCTCNGARALRTTARDGISLFVLS
jgi:hypothetical protein